MLLIALLTHRSDLLMILLELMETRDWDLAYCPDPHAALAQWQRETPDLIIIDVNVCDSEPRVTSCAQTRSIPVLLVIDSPDDAAVGHGLVSSGVTSACDVLDWDHLTQTIEDLVSVASTRDGRRISFSRR